MHCRRAIDHHRPGLPTVPGCDHNRVVGSWPEIEQLRPKVHIYCVVDDSSMMTATSHALVHASSADRIHAHTDTCHCRARRRERGRRRGATQDTLFSSELACLLNSAIFFETVGADNAPFTCSRRVRVLTMHGVILIRSVHRLACCCPSVTWCCDFIIHARVI